MAGRSRGGLLQGVLRGKAEKFEVFVEFGSRDRGETGDRANLKGCSAGLEMGFDIVETLRY